MFGKPLSSYVAFQTPLLLLIAAVWALRLLLSLAGVPISTGQFVSVTGALVLCALYNGWAIGQKGFGSFKQLYGLCLVLGIFSQTLVALAIVLGIVTGTDNIYTVPEFYPPSQGGSPLPTDGKNFAHALAHIFVAGAIFIPIVSWLIGSAVLFLTRKKAATPA